MMEFKHIKDELGNEGVFIPMAEWEEIQKKLNDDSFYEGFKDSVKEVADHINGKSKLRKIEELWNEL